MRKEENVQERLVEALDETESLRKECNAVLLPALFFFG